MQFASEMLVFDPRILDGLRFVRVADLCRHEQRNHSVHYSSQSDRWSTPDGFYGVLDKEFGFTLDAAATRDNAKTKRFFSEKENGLEQDWGKETVFLNPPYSTVGKWMMKAREAAKAGATVVCLVPARTDTAWWQDSVMGEDGEGNASEVRLVRGRLKFSGAEAGAPFPSAVVVYRPGLKGRMSFKTMDRAEQ